MHSHSWAGPVRKSPCRSWRRVLAHVTHSQHSRGGAGGAGGAFSVRRWPRLTREAPTAPRAPTATGCLISHYNLRAARFLPLLLPRFVLRIIECIPLAPAAMRARRRPDNSRVQLRRNAVTPYTAIPLTPSCVGRMNCSHPLNISSEHKIL